MTEQKKKMNKGKKWGIGIAIFLVFGFIIGITSEDETEEEKAAAEAKTEQAEKEREEKKEAKAQEKADKEAKEKEEEQAKIDEEKAKEEEAERKKEKESMLEYGLEQWEAEEDGIKDFLMEEHRDNGLVDIGANNDDFSVMNAFVSDEFRLLSDQEKEYLVNEMGTSIKNLIGSNFGHLDKNNKSKVHVNFIYPNNEPAATQKMSGGWKLKN